MSETQSAAVETEVASVESQESLVTTKVKEPATKAKRFTFGPVWTASVRKGNEKYLAAHREKLIAHAVTLKIGARSDLVKLKLSTLIARTQAALPSVSAPIAEQQEVTAQA
jgi:hypothetical protein